MSCWVVVVKHKLFGTVRKMPFDINLPKEDVQQIAEDDCDVCEYVLNVRESEENECFTGMSSPINLLRK